MVDSIYIRTDHSKPTKYIEWQRENVDHRTGVVFEHGKLKNMRVKKDPDGRLSISGSLPKYLKGSNVETSTIGEVKWAIEKLCYEAGIYPDAARVYG
ncbi:MAG: hypothetical protein AAF391_14025, partial [Bacteroidota bacterium]